MASAAEQLAQNLNFGAFSKATELKKRLWFTLGALIIFRFCSYVPLPGIDPVALQDIFQQIQGGVVDIFNTFSGGALERMSIIALNIMPYISAAIIMQLMTSMSPTLAQMKKEGEAGRKKINQYTRMGTVLLTAVQGYAIATGLEGLQTTAGGSAVIDPGWFFRASTVITLIGGTMFLMWLGEQITARGVGNGISLIIFAGIVAELPRTISSIFQLQEQGAISPTFTLFIFVMVMVLLVGIVFVERAQRRIIVQYPKRQVGNKMFQGDTSHLPLKLNTAGVIPPIFASSLLLMPISVAQFSQGGSEWVTAITAMLGRGQPLYLALYVAGTAFFCFFYTAVVFNPEDTADNLKRYGGFIPGIRPGARTAEYLDYVLTRLTVVGAIYLSIVVLLPEILVSQYAIPLALGGTSLLIIVNVTMDFVAQVHSHLMAHQYEGLIEKSKLRGKSKSRGGKR